MKRFVFSRKGHYTYDEVDKELKKRLTTHSNKISLINHLVEKMSVEEKLNLIEHYHTP